MKHLIPALALAASGTAQANIDIVFDFTYDTNNFFASTERLNALNAAAAVFETRFADTLTAITSSGGNSFDAVFFNPSNINSDITLDSASFAANEFRVYAGGQNLGSSTLGVGGPGGFGCSGFGSFCANATSRGQGIVQGASANDFASWGGAISFNSNSAWHFGSTTAGLDGTENDFFSVAVHELAHVLGFATADSFERLISNGTFTGATSSALFGQNVPLTSDGHWAEGTFSTVNGVSQEAAMDPTIFRGTRKNFTNLDYAAMQDIGWQVTAVPEANTWAMLLAGLGFVGLATRRKMARAV